MWPEESIIVRSIDIFKTEASKFFIKKEKYSKHTSTTVILSQPVPIKASGARQQFINSSHISSGSITPSISVPTNFDQAKRVFTKFTTSSLVITSQIPSQAKTTNSQSSVIGNCCTSGKAKQNILNV
ncbi:hypothetical protein V1478_012256 [Vespula squamosa]|uniref:Uncharacterized protein n=1 Tax=Vespula squamosa TaxID=30214 RepID=A0ABD2ACW8_VESSQ